MSDPTDRDFIGLVAHELRSPVAAIVGYAELLADGIIGHVDTRGREGLGRIGSAARHLRALIDGLELMAGNSQADAAFVDGVDLAPVLRSAADEAAGDAALRNTPFHVDIPDPAPRIRTDPDLLARALHLMLAAALKFPPEGAVSFRVRSAPPTVDIAVVGVALPADARADGPANVRTGVGLRLAMVRRAAAALGGELDVGSGTGASLVLRLPGD